MPPVHHRLLRLTFSKALHDVIYWLKKERVTFGSYLSRHPSSRKVAITTFQDIIDSVSLIPDTTTPGTRECSPSSATDGSLSICQNQEIYDRLSPRQSSNQQMISL